MENASKRITNKYLREEIVRDWLIEISFLRNSHYSNVKNNFIEYLFLNDVQFNVKYNVSSFSI
jgi:hypothetical protein